MKKYLMFVLFFLCHILYAENNRYLSDIYPLQEKERKITFNIKNSNNHGLEELIRVLKEIEADPNVRLTALEINALLSPERGKIQSERLCLDRVNEISQHIKSHMAIPDSLIIRNGGIAWAELRYFVSTSNMQDRDEILFIIDNVPEETKDGNKLVDSRNKQLLDLEGGRPYVYMRKHFFTKLISTNVVISYSSKEDLRTIRRIIPTPIAPSPVKKQYLDRFALKTNLLYFAMLAPNIGVEYRFTSKNSDNWSIGLSFTMPWWSSKDKHKYYRLPFLEIDSKYYLGEEQRHNIGFYAQGGKYELKSSEIGSIGGFGGLGFAYGYLLPIGNSLLLNFEIGMGYIFTSYKQYVFLEEEENYYYIDNSQQSKNKHLFIPTKAGVTLIWKIDKFFTKGRKK